MSSTSSSPFPRALAYSSVGEPTQVIKAVTATKGLRGPAEGEIGIRVLLGSINPSDINVIEGKYADRPLPRAPDTLERIQVNEAVGRDDIVFVPGNEGVAIVESIGPKANEGHSGNESLKEGDWVITRKPQVGTWQSRHVVERSEVLKVPRMELFEGHGGKLGPEAASMLWVNPATAYGMLDLHQEWKEGDWVIQNGANSAVGLAVIQIAKIKGLRSINFVRNRPDIDEVKSYLTSLGATHVFTYDELTDKSFKAKWASIRGDGDAPIAFNCVGGKSTVSMAGMLRFEGRLVTYGAMSKEPFAIPAGMQIFSGTKTEGYWQASWYQRHTDEEISAMLSQLIEWLAEGKLQNPQFEIVALSGTDEEVGKIARDTLAAQAQGSLNKKVLFKWKE